MTFIEGELKVVFQISISEVQQTKNICNTPMISGKNKLKLYVKTLTLQNKLHTSRYRQNLFRYYLKNIFLICEDKFYRQFSLLQIVTYH